MTTAADATAAEVLRHATSFISDVLSQSHLRSRLLSTFRSRLVLFDAASLKPLNLASETLENAISTNNASIRSSSLQLAEKLVLPYTGNAFSSFLLCLIYTLCNHSANAAASLLDVFYLDPSFARLEVAPVLFEELFLVHLVPVLEWFTQRRSKVLSLTSPSFTANNINYDNVSCEVSVVLPYAKVLSKMSGDQASKLKDLEEDYENVIDENCKVFAAYYKDVLVQRDGSRAVSTPEVVLESVCSAERRGKMEEGISSESREIGMRNSRYNPIWVEGEKLTEINDVSRSGKPNSPPSYPQRVSAEILKGPRSDSDPEYYSSDYNDSPCSVSSGSMAEAKEENRRISLFEPNETQRPEQKQQSIAAESSSMPDRIGADYENPHGGGKHVPPKDFVCPITSNLFENPVTLETGQTYERRAIQEWIDRGNSTCPITRQKLQSTLLPKTNYVLKRLIASWKELNPGSVPSNSEYSTMEIQSFQKAMVASTSPNSVISQANFDGSVGQLKNEINKLCMSDILDESEMAVLRIEQFWHEANLEADIQSTLTKPPVINGFVEILFNSVDVKVLRATVFLLCELGSREKSVIHTLMQVNSDVDAIVSLFKKGLLEVVVLIYQLRLSTNNLIAMDMVDAILTVIKANEDEVLNLCVKPRTAATLLLAQMLRSSEEAITTSITSKVLPSAGAVVGVIKSLAAEWAEERIAAVIILLRCIQEDGKCRNGIANKAELAPVLECFNGASDAEKFEIVHFLSELIRSNRRTFNEQVLHVIQDEGTFSTVHTLLSYLQAAPHDQRPVGAGLLLHLDLLVEARKMSIYREEAIDALISCLRNTDFPPAQISAAETLVALHGRFSASGKTLNRAFLLKRAGLDKRFRAIMRMEQLQTSASVDFDETRDEEKMANEWERKMAYALVSHEFGLLFEALADGLKSRYAELFSACFVSATWLTQMLSLFPDTGIREAARICLLKQFVLIFMSTRDIEDKALSMLALNSFIQDSEGLRYLTPSMKDVLKGLRELKKYSPLAFKMLKVLSEGNESSIHEMWNHKELAQADCGSNGEVLSIVCFRDKIFSGHSDGTIKVWAGKGSILRLIQEVQEHHAKAVTSLVAPQPGERLYSGSLDKTIRVWSISNDGIKCLQVHDMKDQVQNLVVSGSSACFIPQGAGVKVHSWNGGSKLLNTNKHVKCLSLAQGKLYCGCHDNSIQEIDLASGTINSIQSGSWKLIGKVNPIQALQVHNSLIYSACHSLDGASVKIWSGSNYGMVGTLPTTADVRAIAVSSELVYLSRKDGGVEVWCKEKNNRVETLHSSSNKVQCMAVDDEEEILVIGTSDGKIQVINFISLIVSYKND